MDVHEYQAKALLARFGVAVPAGEVADTPDRARAMARGLGAQVVLKAQIHAGGRGKGAFRDRQTGQPILHPNTGKPLGGVVLAPTEQVESLARCMLGNVLVTRQTGPQGREVGRVLVGEAVEISREFYLALLLDRASRAPLFIASREGGMDIEEVAEKRPEAIIKVGVDPRCGFSPWIGRKIALALGAGPELIQPMTRLVGALYRAFVETDASMAEINPLIETLDGRALALDAKMTFDDNALFRHPEIADLRDVAEEDPLEVEAGRHGLNYIKLDGNVGCMVNGAGLAMSTMDIIQLHGGRPANFLDVGGGATAEMVTHAFQILLRDPSVKAVLINIFGGIMRCDIVATGVVEAARKAAVGVPVVVRLEGTNVDEGRRILLESGLHFEVAHGMNDAARRVVAAAGLGS